MGFWSNLLKERSKDWFYDEPSDPNCPNDIREKYLDSGSEYISITLKSMKIVSIRVAFSQFYGVVNSYISLDHINGKPAEFNVVTTPSKLVQLDPVNIDRIITRDIPLLGPFPYFGGKLQMEIGLFAVQSGNLAEPFLTILQEMSETAGVSFIGQALPYVDLIKKGTDALVGSYGKDATIQIGLITTYTRIKTGYYVIARIDDSRLKRGEVIIDKNYRLLDKNRSPLEGIPYLVFQISSSPKRPDWFMIPDIVAAHNILDDAVKTRDKLKIREALIAFKTVVLTSKDLILKDAREIYNQVYADAMAVINELEEPLPFGNDKGGNTSGLIVRGGDSEKGVFGGAPSKRFTLRELSAIEIYNQP